MNENLKRVAVVMSIVLAFGFGIAARMATLRNRALAQKKVEAEVQAQQAIIGYPAGEAQLKDDQVYWVNVSGVDKYPKHTNLVALLQEVKIHASDNYRLSGTNRLFNLRTNLLPNRYYRFHRGETNSWFERISDPVPR